MRCFNVVAAALILTLGPGATAQPVTTLTAPPQDRASITRALQAHADAWFARAKPPGATIAAITPDGVEIAVAVGLARKEPATPMTPTDRMMSGSIGKTWVSAVVLQLVEEGKADLDARLSTWMGDRGWFARVPNGKDITLRMLMNHTSGIPEHVTAPAFTAALKEHPDKTWKPEELAAFCLDKDPLFLAGEGWSYADTNYIFVGMVIEKIVGRPYNDELRERFLKPRGLSNTTPVESPDLPGLVSGYTTAGKPFPVPAEVSIDGRFAVNPQFEWTGGGLVTTTTDLARWARVLFSGQVLKPDTMTQMLDGVPAKTGPADKYGLGVQIWPTKRGTVYGHSGYFPGYIAIMAWYPDDRVAAALQVNTDIRPGSLRMRQVLDEVVEVVTGR